MCCSHVNEMDIGPATAGTLSSRENSKARMVLKIFSRSSEHKSRSWKMALLHNQPWQHAFHLRAGGIGIFHSALDDFDHLLPQIPTPVHNRAKDVQVGG